MIFEHQEIDPSATERLLRVLRKWEGTPYRPNHRRPGVGADCVRFVLAVYDELYGLTTEIEKLPPDTAMHDGEKARAFLRQMGRRFGAKKVTDGTMEPGDAVIFAYKGAGPTHVAIASEAPWFYHADMRLGVLRTSFDAGSLEYHGHYRLPNKSTWAR